MQIICNALIIFATIDLAIFAYEQIRTIYNRYQDQKDTEAYLRWANERLKGKDLGNREEEHHE